MRFPKLIIRVHGEDIVVKRKHYDEWCTLWLCVNGTASVDLMQETYIRYVKHMGKEFYRLHDDDLREIEGDY